MSTKLIWWLTPEDYGLLVAHYPMGFSHPFSPQMVLDLTNLGRALAWGASEWYGKVAFSEEQPILSCAPIVEHAKQCSGIWLDPDDLPRLAFMPGMVTDRYLRRV